MLPSPPSPPSSLLLSSPFLPSLSLLPFHPPPPFSLAPCLRASQEHNLHSLKAELAAVQLQLTVTTTERNELEEEGRALQTLLIEKEVLSCTTSHLTVVVMEF